MNMTSSSLINLMTNDVFPEPEGSPTINGNGRFHFTTSSHGSDHVNHTGCAELNGMFYSVCMVFFADFLETHVLD